ncbi:ATP-dependent RNA helicase DHX8, partial [Atractiella rhizophila]
IPYRQIRAVYDKDTITVYQAFSKTIAEQAVAAQNLAASPSFKHGRMTWIKPSWCWMMYRCGYSYKDAGQARVLAIKLSQEHFLHLLRIAHLSHASHMKQLNEKEDEDSGVRVQWDPERGPRLQKYDHRSLQLGIPGHLSKSYVEEWIRGIEDVTWRATGLKKVLDENPDATEDELRAGG